MEINERAISIDCPLSPPACTSADDGKDDEIKRLAKQCSNKVNEYIQGQIQSSIDDYKLLEQMNDVTAQRYKDMQHVAETVGGRIAQLQQKYEDLKPFLDQINEIDEASKRMDQAVTMLDNYLAVLETKIRKLVT
ncbi:unnamed protein product [Meloidogyne enterolobii]|uniref:Uncharacterized protein n=1 Tax=Meloidogyne enterolobii TaxID=390850 RepID=A0ACB0Z3H5_MELEN